MEDIQNREDIERLITAFYARVRKNTDLGPIFNSTVHDWAEHIQRLTDFWNANLFFVRAYKGNPHRVHRAVDKQFNYTIEQYHFGIWLQIWFTTIDDLFEGEKADMAKHRARNMSTSLFMRIFEAKPV